ncbi:IclR family transcriptional regulator [Desulfofundulus sp.]|uniref:IclR family transcriptional regulator n=1 Tax=Desulfofundulus sp. TaxID=2282750 RepID=UPI003C739225
MSNTLRKGLIVLQAISEHGSENGLSIRELFHLTGFPPSTIHRFLQTFKDFGMVEQDPETRNYRLGPQLLKMGLQVRGMLDLRKEALPVLKELTLRTSEDSYLTVVQGNMGVFLERVEGPYPVKVMELVGKEVPLHRGAARKALLAFMDNDFIHLYIKEMVGQQELLHPEMLLEEIKKIRQQGYAITYGDYLDHGVGIAAPVYDFSGSVRASIGIIGIESRFTEERLPVLIREVKHAAETLSRKLGYNRARSSGTAGLNSVEEICEL